MRRQIARHLGAMVVLVAIASHTSAQLTDQQAAAAKAIGKLGGRGTSSSYVYLRR